MTASLLLPRASVLRPHPAQFAYWNSPHRFNTVPAGRRSGKTELAKRKIAKRAFKGSAFPDARFFAGAPTRDQAKRIFWKDLKALTKPFWYGQPLEGELKITLVNGSEIHVIGMDKPERLEGTPWDGGVLDEYANMKAQAWRENVRPALSDRMGWCDFTGVPEGRNHYYELDRAAQAAMLESGPDSAWGHFHWKSADILPPEEIEAAKRDLDELTFQQEYEASFINFEGRAYYTFDEKTHCARLTYEPDAPLIVMLDFNVAPGVAAIGQEQRLPNGTDGTAIIGEVYIPRNSNTPAVCRKIAQDWKGHRGRVVFYGDATGGAKGTAKVEGSDWDLVRKNKELRDAFGDRMFFRVPDSNPAERARVNSVNSRLRAADGTIRMMVDAAKAPHVVKDFEGVALLKGGSGEIDKKADQNLTHLSDAIGYYVEKEFPINRRGISVGQIIGI
jgi:hypothetical protein